MKTYLLIILLVSSLTTAPSAFAQQNRSAQRVGLLMQTYHRTHDTDMIPVMLNHIRQPLPTEQQANLVSWLGALFKKDSVAKATFLMQRATLSEQGKQVLDFAILHPIDSLLRTITPSPGRNDMLWATFFATGDETYLETLWQQVAQYDQERVKLGLYLAAASGKWSLASNARQDRVVRRFIQNKPDTPLRRALLAQHPDTFNREIVQIVTTNKANWRD